MPGDVSFTHTLDRLCQLSVRKAHDPFLDIAWDAPESAIDPSDPRFELLPDEPLGATAWYAAQSPEVRARLGLEFLCQTMRFGIALETSLSRGLLALSDRTAGGERVSRYVLHEVIEECRHSLMFRTFIERAGCETHGLGGFEAWYSEVVTRNAALFPEMYFVYVLAGEIFIDADNRMRLAHRARLHPLVARILQIHVTEEARHMRFAERYLTEYIPQVNPVARLSLRATAHIILEGTARVMLCPTPSLVRRFDIPRAVLCEAFGPDTAHREQVRSIGARVLALLEPPRRAFAILRHADPNHEAQ